MSLLEIKNLHASVDGHEILKGINLTINPGEVHSIMGPNGSGKSTLAQVLARRQAYHVTAGSINFLGNDLLEMKRRRVPGVPIPSGGPWYRQHLLHALGAVRHPQAPGAG